LKSVAALPTASLTPALPPPASVVTAAVATTIALMRLLLSSAT
jgi:hypothetical protein